MKDFLTLAKERYSVRKYKKDPVEQEKIDLILEAAKVAPTACNYQPQKIFVLKSEESRKKLAEVCPCLFDAPLVFVIGYDTGLAASGKVCPGYNFGPTDAAIVCAHMVFEAQDLGLGSCWVGYFENAEVKRVLNLPENVMVCDLLPVGYPAEDAVPAALHTQYRPLEDTVTEL